MPRAAIDRRKLKCVVTGSLRVAQRFLSTMALSENCRLAGACGFRKKGCEGRGESLPQREVLESLIAWLQSYVLCRKENIVFKWLRNVIVPVEREIYFFLFSEENEYISKVSQCNSQLTVTRDL